MIARAIPTIAYLHFDVPMYFGHTGLTAMLKKPLMTKECAIFINKDWTALKLLTAQDIVIHLRRPRNKPINPNSIKFIPLCVNGNALDYPKALKAAIKEQIKKKGFKYELDS